MPYPSIVFLTGAGMSAESGLNTFRDNGGLWENEPVEDICTPEAFKRTPLKVQRFYNERRAQLINQAEPNKAHRALADFLLTYPGDTTLITQNVDNLHERAGCQHVLHMHGELLKARCIRTLRMFDWQADITDESVCPCCQRSGNLRPHVVWFGEIPFFMGEIEDALANCDIFVAIGTSGVVYPAAGFTQSAKANGARTIEVNIKSTGGKFDEQFIGRATTALPQLLKILECRKSA